MSENPGLKNQVIQNAFEYLNFASNKENQPIIRSVFIGAVIGLVALASGHPWLGAAGVIASIAAGKALSDRFLKKNADKIQTALNDIEGQIINRSIRVEGAAEGENLSDVYNRRGFHWRFYNNETQGFQNYKPNLILHPSKMKELTSLSQRYNPAA